MDGTAIKEIAKMSQPNIVEANGYSYTDTKLEVIRTPCVEKLTFNTLKGMTDVLIREIADFDDNVIINVRDNRTVEVYTGIALCDRNREYPYEAKAELVNIQFDRFIDLETMLIMLKSRFVETPELLEVIKLLGTITDEKSAQMTDDGFTQTVVVRKGIAMKDNKVIKPIVKLRPYRTFSEIEQPESEFLLRLSENGSVALFEADGGAWKLKARKSIAEYIRNELEGVEGAIVTE